MIVAYEYITNYMMRTSGWYALYSGVAKFCGGIGHVIQCTPTEFRRFTGTGQLDGMFIVCVGLRKPTIRSNSSFITKVLTQYTVEVRYNRYIKVILKAPDTCFF